MKRHLETLALIIGVTAVYFYSGKLGLTLAFVNVEASAVWPPTGIALATLLIGGYRLWPAIFIGSFLVDFTTQGLWATSLGIATGDTLEALVATELVRRFAGGVNSFERSRTTFLFILLAAIFSTMISATFGVVCLGLATCGERQHCWAVWSTWWIGHMTSNLLIAPLLLIWITRRLPRVSARRLLEGVALLLTLAGVGHLVFWGSHSLASVESLEYLTIPPLLWAAFRFGPHGAITAVFFLSGLALWGTLHHRGPFQAADPNEALLLLQTFTGIIAMTMVVLAAIIVERERFRWRLGVRDAISRILVETTNVSEAALKILQTLCERADWDVGAIWQVDQTANKLVCSGLWQSTSLNTSSFEAATRRMEFRPGAGLPGRVWLSGQPVWISDVTRDDNIPRRQAALEAGLHCAFCFPIKLGSEIVGVMECFRRDIREPDMDFTDLLIPLGDQLGLFIERKVLDESLRASEERYRLVLEDQTDVISRFAADGTFVYVNDAYCRFFGKMPQELLGNKWQPLACPEDLPMIEERLGALSPANPIVIIENRVCDSVGELRWFQFVNRAFFDAGGILIETQSVGRDITEAKRTERRLMELAAIVQSSEDGIVNITPEEIVVSWNHGATQILGYAAEEMIGKNISVIFPPKQFEKARQVLQRVMRGESVENYESLRRHKDGTMREVSVKVSPVADATGKIISMSAIYRDIARQKHMERTILEISANEQRRISHDLHDGLGQHLAGIAFKAKALEEALVEESSAQAGEAAKIVELLNEGISQTRQLACGLDPVELEVAGLPAALQKMTDQVSDQYRLACDFHCNQDQLAVAPQIGTTLFRIVQEGIRNAIHHGRAQRINVELKVSPAELRLIIQDNGRGFVVLEHRSSGLGLHIMQYRASSVGGNLAIHSQPGAGTEVVCVVPNKST